MSEVNIEVGKVFTVAYPFIRATYSVYDESGASEEPCWRPGIRHENIHPESEGAFADGIGTQELTVVSIHKPGKFPSRIFFTRRWRDPSGRIFGKGKLHILSAAPFTRLTRGYRYEYELSKEIPHGN